MTSPFVHHPVMLQENIDALAIIPNGIYIDGTFGRGGHSRAILQHLNEQGRLICLDKDPEAIACAQETLGQDKRVTIYHACFSALKNIVHHLKLEQQINGILLDFGVSSPQLEDRGRGFSFMREGPLDMRMDPTQGISAQEWLAKASVSDMADVIKRYGEEPFGKKIAQQIDAVRKVKPITTTTELAQIVKDCVSMKKRDHHPATKTFQAIRIYINQELQAIETVMKSGLEVLAPGGRFAMMSFHSLEDRLVKRFLRAQSQVHLPKGVAIPQSELHAPLHWVIKRQLSSMAEIEQNPRARSATLRVGQRSAHESSIGNSHLRLSSFCERADGGLSETSGAPVIYPIATSGAGS